MKYIPSLNWTLFLASLIDCKSCSCNSWPSTSIPPLVSHIWYSDNREKQKHFSVRVYLINNMAKVKIDKPNVIQIFQFFLSILLSPKIYSNHILLNHSMFINDRIVIFFIHSLNLKKSVLTFCSTADMKEFLRDVPCTFKWGKYVNISHYKYM